MPRLYLKISFFLKLCTIQDVMMSDGRTKHVNVTVEKHVEL